MSEKRKYDSTVARIAGNIAGHILNDSYEGSETFSPASVAEAAVKVARAIVAETERTEPEPKA
jgi:hypothetical protein